MEHGKLDYGPFFILIVKEREKSYTKAKNVVVRFYPWFKLARKASDSG